MFFGRKEQGVYEYMIVGLGNPGGEYVGTRHNVGFAVADIIAEKASAVFKRVKQNAEIADISFGGKRCLLVKPLTFMNNSGEAVSALMKFYKIPLENVIVVFDDISLPVGGLRVKRKGSAGGHNGIKSIIALCGGECFPRVKVGVGQKPHPDYDLAKWVLSRFAKAEEDTIKKAYESAAGAVDTLIKSGADAAMNTFNKLC